MSDKWFLEIVQDYDGKYSVTMILNGEKVENIPQYLNYSTLRDEIRKKIGIKIPNKKDMFFSVCSDGKKYAYLDNTESREDSRVSYVELSNGWRPKFKSDKIGKNIYIYPHINKATKMDNPCILCGTIIEHICAIPILGYMTSATVTVHIQKKVFEDGTTEDVDYTDIYYDSSNLYEYSLSSAQEKAKKTYLVIQKIKTFPQTTKLHGSNAVECFKAMDYTVFSDEQLVDALELANLFQLNIRALIIQKEMLKRFTNNAKNRIEKQPVI